MNSEGTTSDPQRHWQGRPAAAPPPIEEVRRRAHAFERTIRRRNLREYVVAAAVVLFFGWHAATSEETFARVGLGLIIAGTVWIVVRLSRKGTPAKTPEDLAALSCLDFHRAELARQRDLTRGVWRWYLLPLVPGLSVLLGGQVLAHPESGPRVAAFAAVCALLFLAVAWLNRLVARHLQREIDELEAQR